MAIIPALNEEQSIAKVINGLKHKVSVLVIDDGSKDKTAEISKKTGAQVHRHSMNKGYDAALSTGIEKAIDMGFKYAITIDADGQHNPKLIDQFIQKLDDGYDLVIGVRDQLQRFSEVVFAKVANLIWNLKDPLCGMKAYRLSRFQYVGPFDRYRSIGTLYAIIAAKSDFKIFQLFFKALSRKDKPRFGSGLKANYLILKALYLGIFNTSSIEKKN